MEQVPRHGQAFKRNRSLASWLVLIVMAGLATGVRAQTPEIDSLQHIVKNAAGIRKVDALNELSFRLLLVDFAKAKQTLEQSKTLAGELNYKKGISEATIFQGVFENLTGHKTEAIRLLNIGREQAKLAGNTGWEGYALVQKGNIYRTQGIYDSAKFWYDQSYEVLKDSLHPWHLSVLYRNMSWYYEAISKPQEELFFLQRALAIRERLTDSVLLIDVLVLLSKWHLQQANIEKSLAYLNRAETLRTINAPTETQLQIKQQKAVIFFRQAKYGEALKLYQEVKDFYFLNSSLASYTTLLLDIGELLEEIGNYDISLKSYFDALKIAEEKSFLKVQVNALIGLSRNYYRLKQPTISIDYVSKAIDLAEKNSFTSELARAYNQKGLTLKSEKKYVQANQFFKKGLEIRIQLNDRKGQSTSLANIGETLEALGDFRQALSYHLESVAIKEAILYQSGLAWGYFDLGSVYTKMNSFDKAQFYLDKAEKLARSTGVIIVLINVYEARRELYRKQGKLEAAIRYSYLFEKMKDSVNSTALTNRILSIQSLYDLDKKNQEIELLRQSQQVQEDQLTIQRSKINQQRLIIIGGVIGFVLLSILAFTLYQFFKKTARLNRQIQERNEEIQVQSEELEERNASLALLNKTLSERQEEIAAQSEELSEANVALQTLNKDLAEKNEEMAAQAEELSEANMALSRVNRELSESHEEMASQSEELRESNQMISQLNEGLEEKVKERTEKLQQAFKELDTFFYRSSHDFRRPLTTFMGLAEVAKITVKDPNALDLFQKVKETAVNLDRMLVKLQSISDVGAEQFIYKIVSLQNIFSTTFDSFKEVLQQKRIKVLMEINEIPNFSSFPAFLKIIADNLVENSIHFCGTKDPFIKIAAKVDGEAVIISVSDNGVGIENEYKNRIFEMFFRGNESSKGNGLGLYIVKRAVGKLHGHVIFESQYGVGTTVTVWLPLEPLKV